jgi:ABC-2 type transport system ATP-binding protein
MIEMTELTKRYGGRTAVDALTCTVRPGHVTGFLGPNGAGKSTTLRMILGLNKPTSGTVTVSGKEFRSLPRGLRHAGGLLDAGDVHPGHSGWNHLLALARTNAIPKQRVQEVLEQVGLASAAKRRIGSYSLGMRQRLGIASALLGDPPVLLFDEPLNGLDPEGVLWVRTLFRDLAAEGRTVLVSSHLMTEMEHTADRLIVIGKGRLIADEPVADFAARSSATSVVVRTPMPAEVRDLLASAGGSVAVEDAETLRVTGLAAARISELAFQAHLLLHEVTTHTASLEAAFMELTADSVEYLAGAKR